MKKASKARRAISPVIATVIIVAVAIAISIAVAGWLFGLWAGFAGGNPEVRLVPISAVDDDDNTTPMISILVSNTGSGSDTLLSAVIIYPDGSSETPTITQTTIAAGDSQVITITGDETKVEPGDKIVVELVFEKTGKHSVTMTVTGG